MGDYGNEDLLDECEELLGEEGSMIDVDDDTVGGFQSVVPGAKKGVSFGSVNFAGTSSKIRSGTGTFSKGITLPFMVDRWTDEQLNERVRVQVHLLSGDGIDDSITHRISTKQNEWILDFNTNGSMLSPEGSFNSHLLNEKKVKEDQSGRSWLFLSRILNMHAKTIARRWVVSSIKGRDKGKLTVTAQMRIPLGMKVRYLPVSKAEDDLFNGIKYIVNDSDGAVFLHGEFMGINKDSYSPMKTDASVRSAKAEFAGAAGVACGSKVKVPEYISVDSSDDDSTWNKCGNKTGDDDMAKSVDAMSISGKSTSSIRSNRNPFSSGKKKVPPKNGSDPPSPANNSRANSAPVTRRSSRHASPPKRFRKENEIIVETVDSKETKDDEDL